MRRTRGTPRRRFLAVLVALSVIGSIATAAPAPARQRAPAVRIWPVGDSLTWGYSVPAPGIPVRTSPGGYRGLLDQLLTEEHIRHQFVGTYNRNSTPALTVEHQGWHDGHNQYGISQVYADLDGVAGGATDNHGHWLTGCCGRPAIVPDVIVLCIGARDILSKYDPARRFPTPSGLANLNDANQRSLFIHDLGNRLSTLVNKIFSLRPHARIVLSNVIAIHHKQWSLAFRDYGKAVYGVVQGERALGRRIVYADVWHKFAFDFKNKIVNLPGLISADGVHPDAAGYDVMAHVYAQAIRNVLKL